MNSFRTVIVGIVMLFPVLGMTQTSDSTKTKSSNLTISGTVKEKSTGANIPSALVIQKGVGGKFLNYDGSFQITIGRNDTLLISAMGYGVQKFCFKDSSLAKYSIHVRLSPLSRNLATAVIMPKRKLKEVHKDLEDLRLELPEKLEGLDVASSPITALYQTFSKLERSKRIVAELEHEDRKEALLKEIFKIYVDADIINLSPDEFEQFIAFSNVSDNFLRNATEYELITFFQSRYQEYLALKR